MNEQLDKVSLSEVLEIYTTVSSMVKSLEDKEKEVVESDKSDK